VLNRSADPSSARQVRVQVLSASASGLIERTRAQALPTLVSARQVRVQVLSASASGLIERTRAQALPTLVP
jgi:hypothetical protein